MEQQTTTPMEETQERQRFEPVTDVIKQRAVLCSQEVQHMARILVALQEVETEICNAFNDYWGYPVCDEWWEDGIYPHTTQIRNTLYRFIGEIMEGNLGTLANITPDSITI